MPKQPITRQQRLANERALYRYQQALARGDIETIATILQAASQDEALERMLYALHDCEQPEESLPNFIDPNQQKQRTTGIQPPLPLMRSRKRPVPHPRLQTLAAVLVVLALITSFTALFSNTSLHRKILTATQTVATPQGMVILLFTDGHIQAVRGVTGQSVWTYATGLSGLDDLGQPFYNGLSVQNHVVYAMVMNHLYALNEGTGYVLWKKTFPIQLANIGSSNSQINVDAGIVYMSIQGATQSVVYALAASDGHLLWQAADSVFTGAPFLTASNGIAYIALQDAVTSQTTIEARRGSDGLILWHYQSPGYTWFATVANPVLYVYAYPGSVSPSLDTEIDKRLIALNVSNGDLIWSQDFHFGSYTATIAYAQGILVVDDDLQICVHSATNGAQLWCTSDTPLNPNTTNNSRAVVLERYLVGLDKLYIAKATQSGIVVIQSVAFQTGQPLWTSDVLAYNEPESPYFPFTFAQLQQNTLLVSSGSPLVTALDANNGHILWQINGSAPPAVVQVAS